MVFGGSIASTVPCLEINLFKRLRMPMIFILWPNALHLATFPFCSITGQTDRQLTHNDFCLAFVFVCLLS